jgi:hypothetical protein
VGFKFIQSSVFFSDRWGQVCVPKSRSAYRVPGMQYIFRPLSEIEEGWRTRL